MQYLYRSLYNNRGEPADRSQYNDYAKGRTIRGSNPVRARKFLFLQKVHVYSGAHPATY